MSPQMRQFEAQRMQHLNYCRQLTRDFSAKLAQPWEDAPMRERLTHTVALSDASIKFLLPQGGRILDDDMFKALDESVPLRLPYPCIALEYHANPLWPGRDALEAPKRIIFAWEHGKRIYVETTFWMRHKNTWMGLPAAVLPSIGYLDRHHGNPGIVEVLFLSTDEAVPPENQEEGIEVLLSFLNALQCSNVCTERSSPKVSGKKIKTAHPFDTYHVLTIDAAGRTGGAGGAGSDHRSPREHLRRGHIRRLSDGRKIWVNASVVSAGASAVIKDYAVRAVAQEVAP